MFSIARIKELEKKEQGAVKFGMTQKIGVGRGNIW